MIAGSRRDGSAYVWTDKRGGNHIIDLGTRVVNSELSFLDDNNNRVYYSIPTIQNIHVSEDVTLPTHPTLDNSYIQQFSKENPPRVTFDIILAEELFTNFDVISESGDIEQRDLTTEEFISIHSNEDVSIDDILNDTGMYSVKDLIAIFSDIKSNRRVFTLTTNLQINDLLNNLVIKSIAYVVDKDSRYIVACTIEAEVVHFAQITYARLDAEEVNGLMVNSSDGTAANNEVYANYSLGIDGDTAFSDTKLEKLENFIFNKEADIHVRFGDAMDEYCTRNNLTYPFEYYIMSDEIDRNKANGVNMVYGFRFPSDIGVNITGQTQSSSKTAAYEFYTYKIKFAFNGHSERRIKDIYKYARAGMIGDAYDTVDIFDSGFMGFGVLSPTSVLNIMDNDLDTPSFNNGIYDRETGLYNLVESYKYLGISYNTEKRLKFKDVNSKLNTAATHIVDNTPSTLTSGALTIKDKGILDSGDIQGYECKSMFPALRLSYETAKGIYSEPITIPQRAEIDWSFGVVNVPFDIFAGFEGVSNNRTQIINYWITNYLNDKPDVPVHYGVLFVGAKVLIVLFNPTVMNEETIKATDVQVE